MPNDQTAARHTFVGAVPLGAAVSFRVWAPGKSRVAVVVEGRGEHRLNPETDGYFAGTVDGIGAGALYRYRLDGADELLPDPASQFQPDGPAGPSEVIDHSAFEWRDADWPGLSRTGQVLYEMHVGTFTPEGNWAAATERLGHLRQLGITAIEMMPVHTFKGRFGWGYDVAMLHAPTSRYGRPADLKRFIDRAHALGLGVIHDVVYNHFGPGAPAPHFGAYLHPERQNEWGRSMNFDGPGAGPVRDHIVADALQWIAGYHFDGLRLDATQALADTSEEHILAWIVREARAAAGARSILIISENEPQESLQAKPASAGGMGVDALWNDDFHHAALAALTDRRDAYLHDTAGTPQEFVAAARHGYLFQGQRYDWQDSPRGIPALDLPPAAFVHFLENHDQVANGPLSQRLASRVSPARLRAMTALLLLGPQTPMLFQGQEFASSRPFHYFGDQGAELVDEVREGRVKFFRQFPSMNDPAAIAAMAEPNDPATFERSRLDWDECETNAHWLALHRDLISLRRSTPAFREAGAERGRVDGGVMGPASFLLRWLSGEAAGHRLMLVNLGHDQTILSIPDPLSAPPAGHEWRLIWSSDDIAYGGPGQRPIDLSRRWVLPGNVALVFDTVPVPTRPKPGKDVLDPWQAKIQFLS